MYYSAGTDLAATLVTQMRAGAGRQPSLGNFEGITGYALNWSYGVTTVTAEQRT